MKEPNYENLRDWITTEYPEIALMDCFDPKTHEPSTTALTMYGWDGPSISPNGVEIEDPEEIPEDRLYHGAYPNGLKYAMLRFQPDNVIEIGHVVADYFEVMVTEYADEDDIPDMAKPRRSYQEFLEAND